MTNPLDQTDAGAQTVTPAHMRRWLWGGMATCVVLWLAIPLGFKLAFVNTGFPTTLNEIGDSFGSVSALFSALTMAGVIYSLLLQRADISQTLQELKGSREAQGKLAQTEKQNLEVKKRLVEKQDAILDRQTKASDAMEALFKRQEEALRQQIAILRDQWVAEGMLQLQAKFDRRFGRWQEVRASIGNDELRGQAFIDASVTFSDDGKEIKCHFRNPKTPASLPYDLLTRAYMAHLESMIVVFNEPLFENISKHDRADFGMLLRSVLTKKERLVLLQLFLVTPTTVEAISEVGSPDRAGDRRKALAAVDALGGIEDIAKKCSADAWKAYRDMVPDCLKSKVTKAAKATA